MGSTAQPDTLQQDVSFNAVLALNSAEPQARLQYGSNDFQYGLLWLPAESVRPAPLVVLIHGGCWLNSFDVNHSRGVSSALAEHGYAVWSLEYRRSGDPGGGWPGSFEDIQSGLAHIEQLQSYGADSERVAILGHSAGGHLALLAGVSWPQARLVAGLAAIADIESYARGNSSCEQAAVTFMDAEPDTAPERYTQANPAAQSLNPNSVLLHGTADSIVPFAQTQMLDVPVVSVAGAGHFDWIHPNTEAFERLLQLLDARLNP